MFMYNVCILLHLLGLHDFRLTLYLPHFESQYLVHLQIIIKIAQETSSFHTYGVNDLLDLPGEHCVKRRIRRD